MGRAGPRDHAARVRVNPARLGSFWMRHVRRRLEGTGRVGPARPTARPDGAAVVCAPRDYSAGARAQVV